MSLAKHPVDRPILLVEDEPSLAQAVGYSLERAGYRVDTASDGWQAMNSFRSSPPMLVLLDLMLPQMSGVDVCRLIRAESEVPILIVTAKDAEADKISCLEMGADDYITKPFSMTELVSRIRAHLRRAALNEPDVEKSPVVTAGPVAINAEAHQVWVRGDLVTLPPKEFDLLRAFVLGVGRLMRRDRLIAEVWGSDYYGDTRTLDVHVKRLRDKVELDPRQPVHLKTVRGLGYKFEL
jgi:two-component system, OmpR family, response regulator RegX3